MAEKARHAFGSSENIKTALSVGTIDAYDILFLDGDTDPKVGWIDKNGVCRVVDNECVIVVDGESLPASGKEGKVYIFGEEGYFWNGSEFRPLAQSADLTEIETQVATLETQMASKVDADTVQTMVDTAVAEATVVEVVEF
jgi:uncharacterized protein (DUF342 family)